MSRIDKIKSFLGLNKSDSTTINKSANSVTISNTEQDLDRLMSFIGGNSVSNYKGHYQEAENNYVASSLISIYAYYTSLVKWQSFNLNGEENENSEILERLNNPNEFEDKTQFISHLSKEYCINGKANIWTANDVFQTPERINIINGDLLNYKVKPYDYLTGNKPSSIRFKIDSKELTIPLEDIIQIKDSNCKMQAGKKLIESINNSLEAKNILSSMPGGVFTVSSKEQDKGGSLMGFSKKSKEELNDYYTKSHGIGGGKQLFNIISAPIEIKKIALELKKFGYDGSLTADSKSLRGVFSIPKELYNIEQQGATFDNYINAIRGFLSIQCSSIVNPLAEGLSNETETIKASFKHLPVFDNSISDINSLVDALSKSVEQNFIEDEKATQLINSFINIA